jgi:hypothetical protein
MGRSFNGLSDSIGCGSSAILQPTVSMAISCWINVSAFPSAGGYAMVTSVEDAGSNQIYGLFIKDTGKLAIYYRTSGGSRNYDGTGLNTLVSGSWYNISYTYDPTNGLVGYVNGSVDATVAASGNLSVFTAPATLTFGNDPGNAGRILNGSLAYIGMWNTSLTPSDVDILTRYAPSLVRTSSLIGYWPLGGFSSPEDDFSGNGNDGILTGTSFATSPLVITSPAFAMTNEWVTVTTAPVGLMGQIWLA